MADLDDVDSDSAQRRGGKIKGKRNLIQRKAIKTSNIKETTRDDGINMQRNPNSIRTVEMRENIKTSTNGEKRKMKSDLPFQRM